MTKTFENEGGNIRVLECEGINRKSALVEMMYLYDNNRAGCVICFWIPGKDGMDPEIRVVADRLTSTKYSFDIMEALKYGQDLAELIAKSDKNSGV